MAVVGLGIVACSGGTGAMVQPTTAAPAGDLDTAKPPPQTVTSTPLLPPVPDDKPEPPAASGPAAVTAPLQYDPLYSDEEQIRIRTDLTNAANKALK